MGSARAWELAGSIEAINLELIQLVRGCSDDQLRTTCNDAGENRTVAVIAHHVAHGHRVLGEWLETALAGREVTTTEDEIDAENAEHAASYHDVERQETLRLLTELGSELCSRVVALSDEELVRVAFHRGAGRELTVEGYAAIGYRHVGGHLATIRKALDLQPG